MHQRKAGIRSGLFTFFAHFPLSGMIAVPMEKNEVSIILPTTDEAVSLGQTIERIHKLIPDRKLQIIVVTHPKLTTPEAHAAIRELQKKYADVETFVQTKPGIGGAMQDAFERCSMEYTAIMSADLETDPATLPEMLARMERGADVVATTRWRSGARFKGYDPIKLVLNFFFQQFFRILYWTPLTDLTFGYRIYRTEIVKRIRWEEFRFPLFFEAILKPIRLGYKVAEVETPWVARNEGVSHNSFGQTIEYVRVGFSIRFRSKKSFLK
jgi:dolichol-phosphate mannosyltransferase